MRISHILFIAALILMVLPIQMIIFQQERFEQWIDAYVINIDYNDIIAMQSIWNQHDSEHILFMLIASFVFTILTGVTDHLEKIGKI